MTDLATLSASRLDALYTQRLEAELAIGRRLIAAGFGNERGDDTRFRAEDTGDPLACEYVANADALRPIREEMERRRKYHGSLRPIRQQGAQHVHH